MTHNSHNRLYSENQSFWKARIQMLPQKRHTDENHIPRYDDDKETKTQLMSLFDNAWMEVAGHCRWGNCAGKMKNIFRVGNKNVDTFIKVSVGRLLLLAILMLLLSSSLSLSLTQWHFLQGHGWLVEANQWLPRNNFRLEASTTAALTHFHTKLVCLSKRANFHFFNSITETVKYYFAYFVRKGGYPQIASPAENFAFKGGRGRDYPLDP